MFVIYIIIYDYYIFVIYIILTSIYSSVKIAHFSRAFGFSFDMLKSGAPNGNFRENICSEDDLRTRIFGTFVVKFLACLPLLGFSNIYKMV